MKRGVKIFLTAVGVGLCVMLVTLLFMKNVSGQLWENSVNGILAATEQGQMSLDIKLRYDREQLESLAAYASGFESAASEGFLDVIRSFAGEESDISLYYPEDSHDRQEEGRIDRNALDAIENHPFDYGILEPHISTVTGMQVFDIFRKAHTKDGKPVCLVKEYKVRDISDQFTLTFYNDAGFSYIVNTSGDILIRPSHPSSNKTAQNLMDLVEDYNDEKLVESFGTALQEHKKGAAVLKCADQRMTFCYVPLMEEDNWYLVSIIPRSAVVAQTNDILVRTVALLLFVISSIVVMALFYLRGDRNANRVIENHARFISHLYNSIPEGICQITIGPPMRVRHVNEEGARQMKYEGALEYQNGKGVLLDEFIHPEDREETRHILRKASETGRRYSYSHRVIGNEGIYHWVGGLVEKTQDADGEGILIATFHDITKEKAAELEREQEHMLERRLLISAVSSLYPLIVSCNLDQNRYQIIFQDENGILPVEEVPTYTGIVESIGKIVHPEDKEAFLARFGWDAVEKHNRKDRISIDGRFLLGDGQYHWVTIQMIPVQGEGIRDRIYIIMVSPIDEQKHEEEQRLQVLQAALNSANAANHAKSEFLSRMSHDIRTPMNAIVGMTAIATSYAGDQERVQYCLSKISDSSAHLLSLINDVLDMSKIESGKMVLNSQPFYLSREIQGLLAMLQTQIKEKKLVLETKLNVLRHDAIVGDALRFRQIFLNIAGNAVKFTPAGGHISIQISELESSIKDYGTYQFVFSDTGPGMPQEFLNKIFEPFERVGTVSSQKAEGTGLGMSITKNIVELMNGTIHVKSELGRGSTFTVMLHFQLQEPGRGKSAGFHGADVSAEQKVSACGAVNFKGKRVLLVEDNELNREIALELIGATGAEIDEACNGAEAVEKMASSPEGYYSMIITDIQMPCMDGYEEAQAIRKMERSDARAIPIVAMTANAFSEDVEKVRAAGMDGHVAKPVDIQELYEMMEKWMNVSL